MYWLLSCSNTLCTLGPPMEVEWVYVYIGTDSYTLSGCVDCMHGWCGGLTGVYLFLDELVKSEREISVHWMTNCYTHIT